MFVYLVLLFKCRIIIILIQICFSTKYELMEKEFGHTKSDLGVALEKLESVIDGNISRMEMLKRVCKRVSCFIPIIYSSCATKI